MSVSIRMRGRQVGATGLLGALAALAVAAFLGTAGVQVLRGGAPAVDASAGAPVAAMSPAPPTARTPALNTIRIPALRMRAPTRGRSVDSSG